MSQDDQLRNYVPRRLNDKPKFLFWHLDIAVIGLVGIVFGVYAGLGLGGLVLGVGMAAGWSRLKSGKHPGMAAHVMYWFTGKPHLKSLPASHLRELIG